MEKDSKLLEIVDRLRSDVGFEFVIIDRWDADLVATGIALPEDHDHLVYVSVRGVGIAFQCERPAPSRDVTYHNDEMVEGASYAELLVAVRSHLA